MQVCAVIEDRARAGAIAGLDDLLNTVEQEVSAFKDAVAPLLGPSSK
jgi:hypothetical protein